MAKIDEALKEPDRDPQFAKRMEIALDGHPRAPAMKDGRLTWLQNELKLGGMEVTLQTIHRWYHGLARPRNRKMIALAKALRRDPTWLADGRTLEVEVASTKRLRVLGDGSANCLIGFIQLAGWQCAIPDPEDEGAEHIDFYAIIKGRQYRVHASTGQSIGKSNDARFTITEQYEKCNVFGVRQTGPLCVEVFQFPSELIARHGERKVAGLEIVVRKKGDAYFVGKDKVDVVRDFKSDVIQ